MRIEHALGFVFNKSFVSILTHCARPMSVSSSPTKPLKPDQRRVLAEALLARYAPWFESRGFYLLSVGVASPFGALTLAFFMDHLPSDDSARSQESVTLSHCYDTTQAFLDVLETDKQLEPLDYHLEVSSPGLFRELSTARELMFYIGSAVEVSLPKRTAKLAKNPAYEALAQRLKRPMKGTLVAFDADTQTITIAPESANAEANCQAGITLPWQPSLIHVALSHVIHKL
jgi:ribosome maturation factor RimP